jgi:hypothetical protein
MGQRRVAETNTVEKKNVEKWVKEYKGQEEK